MKKKAGKKKSGRYTTKNTETTRKSIILAALKAFSDMGFEGTSLREIAAAVGVTHGVIRHHFDGKEGLWRAVVDFAMAQYADYLTPLLAQVNEMESLQLLKLCVRNFVYVSAQYPEIAKIIMNDCKQEGPRLNYVYERMIPLLQAVEPIFLKVQAKGLLRKFNHEYFFVFLVSTGSAPFAVSALTSKVLGCNILAKERIFQHADMVVSTLFGT